VRFFLDNDVPVSVGRLLGSRGHDWWSAYEAGLAAEGEDDNLTVYADGRRAVLVTLDREFSRRRRANAYGRHLRLRCPEPDAADVLEAHLEEVLQFLNRDHVTVTVSRDGVRADSGWA
jgi:predicted nuclease of predicted toxin-antitoxin system